MPKLPVISYLEVIKALNKIGYNIDINDQSKNVEKVLLSWEFRHVVEKLKF